MKKVLIIEDDQIVGTIYRRKFQSEGFEVALAADGEAGLRAVGEFGPDAVVLDLMLPRLNGVEVLRKIRGEPSTAALPVIVLSNAYLSTLLKDAADAGANQCLIKASASPKQVADAIRQALSGEAPPPPKSPGQSTEASPASADAPTPTQETATTPDATPPDPAEERAYESSLKETFLNASSETLAHLRTLLQTFVKAEGEANRLASLFALYRRVHSVTGNAAVAGLTSVSRLCAALEALLKELYEKPKNINASTIRTTAQTIDFLGQLFDLNGAAEGDQLAEPKILVVDDEAISRRAVVYALEKAQLRSTSLDDPAAALKRLAAESFDLIFLDVDMPGLNGFDMCTQLRTYETNAKTPVIFVTGLTDFESRARSTLSGGTDLIAKPFLFMELAVKAVSHILRAQITPPRA
jgi:DNA-binding response OmpR family regulator